MTSARSEKPSGHTVSDVKHACARAWREVDARAGRWGRGGEGEWERDTSHSIHSSSSPSKPEHLPDSRLRGAPPQCTRQSRTTHQGKAGCCETAEACHLQIGVVRLQYVASTSTARAPPQHEGQTLNVVHQNVGLGLNHHGANACQNVKMNWVSASTHKRYPQHGNPTWQLGWLEGVLRLCLHKKCRS